MSMTIEEIRKRLDEPYATMTEKVIVEIIDSIVVIRTDAYDKGWNDAEAEAEDDADH